MKVINIINYEQYALDYLEGDLSPQLKKEMEAFLDEHSDVKAELHDLEFFYLEPDDRIVYQDKSILLQKGNRKYFYPILGLCTFFIIAVITFFYISVAVNNQEIKYLPRQNNNAPHMFSPDKDKMNNGTQIPQDVDKHNEEQLIATHDAPIKSNTIGKRTNSIINKNDQEITQETSKKLNKKTAIKKHDVWNISKQAQFDNEPNITRLQKAENVEYFKENTIKELQPIASVSAFEQESSPYKYLAPIALQNMESIEIPQHNTVAIIDQIVMAPNPKLTLRSYKLLLPENTNFKLKSIKNVITPEPINNIFASKN